MVSLFDMMLQKPTFKHLSTSIPSLDSLLMKNIRNGIYDFESVPNCTGVSFVVGSLIVSHLSHSSENRAIIIDTLHPFPWHSIVKNEKFQDEWLDNKLISYTADTFAKLFALLMSDKLDGPKESTIVVINNFHELLELYKLELSAAYEEALLKFQVLTNSILINSREKSKAEGYQPRLPEIPAQSALLRENPALKYQSHASTLTNMISQYTYKNSLICILIGYLSSKYQTYRPKPFLTNGSGYDSPIPSSASSSTPLSQARPSLSYGGGRLVLSASLGGNYTPTNSASASSSRKTSSSTNSSLDSFITSRLIFYKDWYHKTPHFKENHTSQQDEMQKTLINSSQLKMVFAVKTVNLHQMGSENGPVYFDYDNGYYDDLEEEEEISEAPETRNIKVIDLSGSTPIPTDATPEPLLPLQTSIVNSPNTPRLEVAGSNGISSHLHDSRIEKERFLPSSPNLSESQINTFLPSADSQNISKSQLSQLVQENQHAFPEAKNREDPELEIDASDDDIMGSLLVNIVDEAPN